MIATPKGLATLQKRGEVIQIVLSSLKIIEVTQGGWTEQIHTVKNIIVCS